MTEFSPQQDQALKAVDTWLKDEPHIAEVKDGQAEELSGTVRSHSRR